MTSTTTHIASTFTNIVSVSSRSSGMRVHDMAVDKMPRPKTRKGSKLWSSFKNKAAARRSDSREQQAFAKSSTSLSGILRTASQKFSIRPRWPKRRSNRGDQNASTSQGISDEASVVWHSDSEDDLFGSEESFGGETTVEIDSTVSTARESPDLVSSEDSKEARVASPDDPCSSVNYDSLLAEKSSTGDSSVERALSNLEALDGGVVFADRYRIAHERIPGNPNCRFATELTTSRRVFLKFYTEGTNQWKNAVRMHELTRSSSFVCQLLCAIEDEEGFPPCLVFERGNYTLTRRLASTQTTPAEQRTILYAILEALEYLHSQNLIHGNLTPSKFLWFESDFSWKLSGLDHAAVLDEPATLPQSTSRYAAPEIVRAVGKGATHVQLHFAADMWSFGVMAFEILTNSCVYDAIKVQEVVRKRVEVLPLRKDKFSRKRRSVLRKGRPGAVDGEDGLRFVYSLLRTNATERQVVTGALDDIFFRSAIDNCQAIGSRASAFSESELKLGDICKWPEWTWVQIFNNHTSLTLQVEHFASKSSEDFPFNLREAEETERFYDDFLPGHPVHVLRLEQDTRLHMRIVPEDDIPFSIEGIVAVRLAPPDADFVELETVQSRQRDTRDITALLQPSKFRSRKMHVVSPTFGLADRRYLKLTVQLRVLLGAPFRREVDLYYHVYCKCAFVIRAANDPTLMPFDKQMSVFMDDTAVLEAA